MNNVDLMLDKAFQAFNTNDLRLAETLCREAMRILPTHGDALYLLGLIAYREKSLNVALDLLHEAVTLYPSVSNYELAYAEVLRAKGLLDEALDIYLRQMNHPKVRTEAGFIYLSQGKMALAKQCFHTALKDDEKIASAYLGLAMFAKNKKERENFLLKAFSCEANENTAYQLALFYVRAKDFAKAETILKDYLIFSRDWTLFAAVLEGLKRPDEAMVALQKAIDLDAYNTGAFVQQGLLLEHSKDLDGAACSYRKALALDDSLIEAHDGLSNVLMAKGDFALALEHTRRVILHDPNHSGSLYKLGILLEQTEDFEEALGIYFKLLISKPNKKHLEKRIHKTILALAQTKKRLAKKFAKGWLKNFPCSRFAQQTWNMLKVLSVAVLLGCALPSFAFDDEQNLLAWDMKYAAQGDAESQYNMAKLWEEGKKVPKDLDRASFYYKQAANQNYVPAVMALARLYGTKNNTSQAILYYEQAAALGAVQAQLYLASYYEEKADYALAYSWLEKAMRNMFPAHADLHQVSPKLAELHIKLQSKVD